MTRSQKIGLGVGAAVAVLLLLRRTGASLPPPTLKSVRKPPQDISSALRAASQAYGVPYSTLAAIAFVESRYNPLAKAATAAGLMQLQPRTAEALGVSDRFNARQSAMGAAKFLKGLYQQFGDWTTAIAAYNWGPGNVKANRSPSQWRDRTQTYVANVLFAKSRV